MKVMPLVLSICFSICQSCGPSEPAAGQVDEVSENIAEKCTIVILGSSTAEGVGPSVSDSTWVSRYSNQVNQKSNVSVVNLAKGGYTTYQILPSGSEIPPALELEVDEERNLTKALTYEPSSIIINMPSNDAAKYISAEDQLANFGLMIEQANAAGIEVYICTTQPRNFDDPKQIAIQAAARDAILEVYGKQSIDFWNEIADEKGWIQDAFDAGDGIHLNDAGHRLLSERVMNSQVETACQ